MSTQSKVKGNGFQGRLADNIRIQAHEFYGLAIDGDTEVLPFIRIGGTTFFAGPLIIDRLIIVGPMEVRF